MKAAIVYVSTHHGNTKKAAEAAAAGHDAVLINALQAEGVSLEEYDLIGFASGIAFGKYYPQMLSFMEKNLPEGKKVFFMHTAGAPGEGQCAAAKAIADARRCECLGVFCCRGFDTFGPFKLVGGIAKGHPDADDLKAAAEFYAGIEEKAERD